MNSEELAKIEERWIAASGAPWSLVDKTDQRGLRAVVPLPGTKFLAVRADYICDAESAIKHGACKSAEEWVEMLQSYWRKEPRFSLGRRCIDVRPKRVVEQENSKRITALISSGQLGLTEGDEHGDMLGATTEPTIAFSAEATEADINFVLNAANDVGRLVHEQRKAQEEIEKLKYQLQRSKEEASKAILEAAAIKRACRAFKDAATGLAGLDL